MFERRHAELDAIRATYEEQSRAQARAIDALRSLPHLDAIELHVASDVLATIDDACAVRRAPTVHHLHAVQG